MLLGGVTGIYSVGSTLLSVAIASSTFISTGSVTRSALVFIVQYLPVALFIKPIWQISENHSPQLLINRLCIAAAVISVLSGIAYGSLPSFVLYGLLSLRGLVECSLKQSRSVMVKLASTEATVGSDSATIQFFEFSGQACGAILATMLLGKLSLMVICCIDASLFIFSKFLSSRLPDYDVSKPESGNVKSILKIGKVVCQSPRLNFFFCVLVCIVIVLQSVNQTLRTWLPLNWLDFEASGSGITEVIGLFGIVAGIAVARYFAIKTGFRPSFLVAVVFISAALFNAIFIFRSSAASLPIYFLYMTSFEICVSYALGAMISNTSQEFIKGVMALFYGVSYGGLCFTGVIFSVFTDTYGLNRISCLIAVIVSVLAILFYSRLHFECIFDLYRKFHARYYR
ncbi:hypothetical protein [Paraburkholderia sacchari]|uniref:hypothetical protein n=1 Tax=Paraburkholderia sacchari TaxID=159450 RepID=UPI000542F9E5|nr:hypothetical protein [Paraburkholderia sacchari]NLP65465.1 MFS transporter [Paraburkholderia sacchari]